MYVLATYIHMYKSTKNLFGENYTNACNIILSDLELLSESHLFTIVHKVGQRETLFFT